MNLLTASRQWAERPNDERFGTLAEMLQACRVHKDSAREATSPVRMLRVMPEGDDGANLSVVGQSGIPARLTHWSFGQLAAVAGAPAGYLRRLPGELASNNINHGLAKHEGEGNLLIHKNGNLVLRSLTSDRYARIWNCDVLARLQDFGSAGWMVPPARPCRADQPGARPATEADVLTDVNGGGGLSVKVGDMIAPAGLYASDHDCFVFMVNESRRISDGSDGGLSRGFFLTNSEVGAAALKVTSFLYRHVCGNHIVWGAENVNELRIVHRGDAEGRFASQLSAELRRYADSSATDDEARVQTARTVLIGDDKEAVLDALFQKLRGDLPRCTIELGYEQAEANEGLLSEGRNDPRSVWGMVQGLTAHAATLPFADERNKVDRAAGKVLAMSF